MAKLGKQKVFVGKVYKSKDGDLRIPIVVRDTSYDAGGITFPRREIHYIQKRNGDSDWEYRPDIYSVSETQFASKFFDYKLELTEPQLDEVCQNAQKFFRLYFTTLEEVAMNLNKILKVIK